MASRTKAYYSPGDEICRRILKDIEPNNIREYLKYLSAEPHISSTRRDVNLSEYIRDLWRQQGLDKVELIPYNVLLSYPDPNQPNQVLIVTDEDDVLYSARRQEAVLDDKDVMQPFNAYSPKGIVTADPVYANFGKDEDFDYLEKLGIRVAGKICVIRYGKIYRGTKVSNAAKRGAVGVVLFLCPSHVSADGIDEQNVYPHTWWMPGDAIQRGDIREEKGDPQTPGYPSIGGAYRIPIDQIDTFPKIPCQPIGYNDAIVILRQLNGSPAPVEWTMENGIQLGPGFKRDKEKLKLVVNNRLQQEACYNVIGSIEGIEEPDRYVLLGNHRDAWVYGAADPSSGTAQMLEVSRVLGSLRKEGWRPNRTIMFCSWGGEEFGLIGSTEWIEEHIHSLTARAVAYINVDICVAGDVFHPEACPMLEDVVAEASRMVPDPKQPQRCLYDVWKATFDDPRKQPQIHPLGPGTDHVPFYFYAGVSAINLSWLVDTKRYPNLFLHPAYHTAYDNFDMMDRFIDPGFLTHQACSRICGLILYRLANSSLLPHDVCHLADRIANSWSKLRSQLSRFPLRIDYLELALAEYQVAARERKKQLEMVDHNNQLLSRRLNDEAMLTERIFLRPETKSIFRHLIFSPYQDGFSVLSNKLSEKDENEISRKDQHQFIEKYISDVLVATKAATKFLQH